MEYPAFIQDQRQPIRRTGIFADLPRSNADWLAGWLPPQRGAAANAVVVLIIFSRQFRALQSHNMRWLPSAIQIFIRTIRLMCTRPSAINRSTIQLIKYICPIPTMTILSSRPGSCTGSPYQGKRLIYSVVDGNLSKISSCY